MSPATGRVEFGRIVGAHALRGEVRVRLHAEDPKNLQRATGVWLGTGLSDAQARFYPIEGTGSGRAGELRLALEGVESRESAEALRGQVVMGDAESLAKLAQDEFYWHQLVGCLVETESGQAIGRVREIWQTGAHDVLVVDGETPEPILIPTAREIMKTVDLEAGRIVIDAIPGLLGEIMEGNE
jgi:16S rRNA processing protein RimM